MCLDHFCPSAKKCYRHEAEADGERQSYADFKRVGGADKCDSFMRMTVSTKKRLDVQTGRKS